MKDWDGWDVSSYGTAMADVFDGWYGVPRDADTAADFLAKLAGPGPALELGVGTGRVAVPLSERGVEVHGVDSSTAMLERLRAKLGGQDITVHVGDIASAECPADVKYEVIYALYSMFYLLLTPEAQRSCLVSAAQHLTPGGAVVIQALTLDEDYLNKLGIVRVGKVELDHVIIEAARHDPVRQRVDNQQIKITEQGIQLTPVCYRYVRPPELDLMAELAGLRLRGRYGGWHGEPFGPPSPWNLSIYELADA